MEIVKRAWISSEHSVVLAGRAHNLGVLKDFRKHPRLDEFLPRGSETSMSWVHLDPDEVLEVHTHPIPSLILLCAGRGRTLGEVEAAIEEGDAVLVRTGDRHGFVGAGPDGFWGLSVQFEPRALYEDMSDPWVTFGGIDLAPGEDALHALLARNERHKETFATHRIFVYARLGRFDREEARRRLLDGLQVWSTHFQRAIQARVVFSYDPTFASLARWHRDAELGHDLLLSRNRPDARALWDPILEASASWFTSRMMTLGDVERAVLIHLVVEAAGEIFYRTMHPYLRSPEADEHFSVHTQDEGSHVARAIDLLEDRPELGSPALPELLRQGWGMLGAMLGRIADLAAG